MQSEITREEMEVHPAAIHSTADPSSARQSARFKYLSPLTGAVAAPPGRNSPRNAVPVTCAEGSWYSRNREARSASTPDTPRGLRTENHTYRHPRKK